MIIVVDFDGTCVTHDFPHTGKDIGAAPVLRKLYEKGHAIILFTMRSNQETVGHYSKTVLGEAVRWFEKNGIPLHGINKNPDQHHWTSSPKAYGHIYIDDAALGCPLIYDESIHNKPFCDWKKIEEMLIEKGIL